MLQSFFKQAPTVDTPYRELIIRGPHGGWMVRLLEGTAWGRENSKQVREIQAKSFDEAKAVFDNLFREQLDAGWRPYSPTEVW